MTDLAAENYTTIWAGVGKRSLTINNADSTYNHVMMHSKYLPVINPYENYWFSYMVKADTEGQPCLRVKAYLYNSVGGYIDYTYITAATYTDGTYLPHTNDEWVQVGPFKIGPDAEDPLRV